MSLYRHVFPNYQRHKTNRVYFNINTENKTKMRNLCTYMFSNNHKRTSKSLETWIFLKFLRHVPWDISVIKFTQLIFTLVQEMSTIKSYIFIFILLFNDIKNI